MLEGKESSGTGPLSAALAAAGPERWGTERELILSPAAVSNVIFFHKVESNSLREKVSDFNLFKEFYKL